MTNSLFNLINYQADIDKICLYAKDPYKATYQLLVNEKESTGFKYLNDFKGFVECSNDIDDSCKNIVKIESKKIAKLFWQYGCWFA